MLGVFRRRGFMRPVLAVAHFRSREDQGFAPRQMEWINKAGVKWKLTATPKRAEFAVGPECVYFKNGYTIAKVAWGR
jgi:hypothetical protein